MEQTHLLLNIINSMRKFQEVNLIKKQCITNSQYLYDIIISNRYFTRDEIRVKAVIVVSSDEELDTFTFVGGHLVLVFDDGSIIDPSYDIFSLKNRSYFDNIKDVMDSFKNEDKELLKTNFKKGFVDHIHFMKIAEQINSGECLITEKQFYNDQADYIEKLYAKSK
jgi:hypothetical protein